MATGYTAKLMESGESFKDFALHCAHAFGALVTLRDEPMDAPIPTFKPDSYYVKALANAHKELSNLKGMTTKQKMAYGKKEKEEAIAIRHKIISTYKEENARLEAMKEQVDAWEPPSPDHTELKTFMLEQIEMSKHDLGYSERELASVSEETEESFWEAAVGSAESSIPYYEERVAEEQKRCEGRNTWVEQIQKSLAI